MEILTRNWGEFVYAPPECRVGGVIRLPESEAHHLFDVRRVRGGDHVHVTDGAGMVYSCFINGDRQLTIEQSLPEFGEERAEITLAMAVLKGDANKLVVDEATQLGARVIRFFHGRRSEGRLTTEKLEKLSRVALAAMKQCGRARLPQIELCRDLSAALAAGNPNAKRLIAHPLANREGEARVKREAVEVHVGPEGGFADEEVREAIAVGCRVLDLGVRRLRAETAAAAALITLRD
jgi:16S rRNA (uracil1498-N3)-methyltransferase